MSQLLGGGGGDGGGGRKRSETAFNEARDLLSEGPIKNEAGGSAGCVSTHPSHTRT